MPQRPRRFARIRRFCRRGLATLLGLWLGWQVAGVAFNQLPSATYADEAPRDAASASSAPQGPRRHATESQDHDGHGHSPAAQQLVPGDGQTDWYGSVIWGAIALFAAAVLIGVPLLRLLPPEPQPAGGHDDDHDHSGGHEHDHPQSDHTPPASPNH